MRCNSILRHFSKLAFCIILFLFAPIIQAQILSGGTNDQCAGLGPGASVIYDVATNSFPCIVNYWTDTGSANAYAISPTPGAPTAYVAGQTWIFKAANANTGASTLNVSGLGTKNITKTGTTALASGDIKAGQIIEVTYDGTEFQIVSTLPSSGGSAPSTEPFDVCVPDNTGYVTPFTFGGTSPQAIPVWEFNAGATFTATGPSLLCTWIVTSNVSNSPAFTMDIWANDGTAGNTMTFKICVVTYPSGTAVANSACTATTTQNFTTTSTANAHALLTFTSPISLAAGDIAVVRYQATAQSGLSGVASPFVMPKAKP